MDHVQETFNVSCRRACGLLGLHRSTYHYRSQDRRDAASLVMALRDQSKRRRRWGYRRLLLLLRREGWMDNHKRIFRLYQQEEL